MRVELSPVEKYLDKDIRIKNIEDCRLRMERKAKDRLRVEYRGEGWENLDEVRFLDKAGNELPSRGWSGGGLHPDTGYYREYRFEMPDGGKVIVDIWKGVRVVPGLFELKDVPLPGAPSPEDEVDISRSEPASPPAAKTSPPPPRDPHRCRDAARVHNHPATPRHVAPHASRPGRVVLRFGFTWTRHAEGAASSGMSGVRDSGISRAEPG